MTVPALLYEFEKWTLEALKQGDEIFRSVAGYRHDIGLHYIPITMNKREKVYLYKRRYNFPVSSLEDSEGRWNAVLSSLL
jgi:hypothetical protein